MATKTLKKAQYGTSTGKGMYEPNTGMNRPAKPMGQAKKGAIVKKKMARGGTAVKKMNMGGPGSGTAVPVGTRVSDGRVWNGKGYDPAPVGTPAVTPKTPVNQTPVATPGTVMNDGRVWDGKRYVTPLTGSKRGGAKMAKGGMTKAKKFAALAPPYNKATAADRIAGAKKNKRK
jgi:hypothetical protein